MSKTVLFTAGKFITMDPERQIATHVAVRAGVIVAVGGRELTARAEWDQDHSLNGMVVTPGFVEGHAHLLAGALWAYQYVGSTDCNDPAGRLWHGCRSNAEVIEALQFGSDGAGEMDNIVGWGFDPIFITGENLNRTHLDKISTTQPVVVVHSNLHLLTVNSFTLDLVGYNDASPIDELGRFADGSLNGEISGLAAMFPVTRRLKTDIGSLSRTAYAIRGFGSIAHRAGVTTSADLLNELVDDDVKTLISLTSEPGFPIRIVPALNGIMTPPQETAARAIALRSLSTEKLRLGSVKLMTDGSIQAYSARLKHPGYINDRPNGIWNMPPAQIVQAVDTLHQAGIQVHIHANGDEASDVAVEAIEKAQSAHPKKHLHHYVQHGQLIGPELFERMGKAGIGANLFVNHLWYFGDQHCEQTVGPDRAARMNDCRAALDNNVLLAIHSDAPVTPMAPLFTAWCAVNRITPSGRTLGENRRISVDEALRAITLGGAESLSLDAEIGSIEVGKRADFTVLGDDPTSVDPAALKDVPVLGTVLGGRVNML